jgi:hypothetical protein
MSKTESAANRADVAIERVLDTLDRWDERMHGHQNQKRSHARNRLRQKIMIYIPTNQQSVGEALDSTAISVWTRNISRSGICFIHTASIKVDDIIVCLSTPNSGAIYFHAKIVRRRQVHDGFYEYGAEFKERAHL